MNNSLLTFLGKDSGFGDNNNSAYIEDNNNLYIIDCGFTVFNIIKNKFDFKKYDSINVIITHLHNDHAGSLSQVILYLFFIYNIKVNVVSKCENIKKYLEITGTPNEAYTLQDWLENLEFIKTIHTKYLDAYGFRLIINNKTLIYTGDTNTLEPFIPYLDNTNELYIDVSRFGDAHLKIDEVYEKLKQKGINIYLKHLDDKKYINNITNNKFN